MNIDLKLLKILVCPETLQELKLLSDPELSEINKKIIEGGLVNRSNEKLDQVLQGALIREDKKVIFPIISGIPVMLLDQAINLTEP